MEKREVTARLKIKMTDDGLKIKSKNTINMYEELTIITKTLVMLASNKHSELDSYEWEYFDGEDPCICIAYNIETKELQISISDIPENMELGMLEFSKQVVLNDLLGS